MYLNDWIVQRDPLAQGFVDLDLQGFVDLDLGSSPGWWAAIVATYCPSRMVEHPKSKSTKPCARTPGSRCTAMVLDMNYTVYAIIFGRQVEAAIAAVLPSDDPLDSPSFSTVEYINATFPTEQGDNLIDSILA